MMLRRARSIWKSGGTVITPASKSGTRRLTSSNTRKHGDSANVTAKRPTTASSKEELLAARQRRKEGMSPEARMGAERARDGGTKLSLGSKLALTTLTGGGALVYAWHYQREMFNGTPVEDAIVLLKAKAEKMTRRWADPSSNKLLPDWPMPFVPPGVPCPPLLVLDLEGTLLATVYDAKNGWRYAKRPGLDDFLKEMSQMYEIAIFTDSVANDEVINKLDPTGYISYRMFRDATRWTNGKHVKDLSCLNRPIEKIIIVDDNPDCFSLQPENGIKVKTFSVDGDGDDTVLIDLAHFLRAMATQDVHDFREVLKPFIGQDSSAHIASYRSKIATLKNRERAEMSRGLGGYLRSSAISTSTTQPSRRPGMTSKEIVGDGPEEVSQALAASTAAVNAGSVPVTEKSKGGLWKRFDIGAKERLEGLQAKNEAFHMALQARETREQARKAEEENEKRR